MRADFSYFTNFSKNVAINYDKYLCYTNLFLSFNDPVVFLLHTPSHISQQLFSTTVQPGLMFIGAFFTTEI
jgi:hypothetical protein